MTRRALIGNHPMLGKVSDKELACMLGASKAGVCRARKNLGILAFDQKRSGAYVWTEEVESLLGTVSDIELAKTLGLSRQAVQQARKRKGVESNTPQGKHADRESILRTLVVANNADVKPDASRHDPSDKQAGWSRANERKRIAAGGRRLPGGVLPADAADALAQLHDTGYAPTLTGCIARALVAALKQ